MGLGGGEHAGEQQGSRRAKRRAIGGAVAVAMVAISAWPIASNVARDQVVVLSDPRSALRCGSGPVTLELQRTMSGTDMATPATVASPDMDCSYTFSIHNRGRTTVRIEAIRFHVLGADAGSGVRATDLSGLRPSRPLGDDAVFDVEQAIAGGTARTFTVRLRQNPVGCSPPGSGHFFTKSPAVTVRSLGIREVVSPLGATFGARGHESLDCGARND